MANTPHNPREQITAKTPLEIVTITAKPLYETTRLHVEAILECALR